MSDANDNKISLFVSQLLDSSVDEKLLLELDRGIQDDPAFVDTYLDYMILYMGLEQCGSELHGELSDGEDVKSMMSQMIDLDQKEALEKKEAELIIRQKEIQAISQLRLEEYLKQQELIKNQIGFQGQRIKKAYSFQDQKWLTRILAACLVFAGLIWLIFQESSTVTVAKLTNSYQTKWAFEPDENLHDIEYYLLSGLAEIEFNDGAKIILEGPANFKLESANGATLNLGKLSARVPEKAIGFTVKTPNASIVDLGTEFTLHVKKNKSSDVYVFAGEVEISTENLSYRVNEGDAKTISSDGQSLHDIVFDRSLFVSNLNFSSSGQDHTSAYAKMVIDGQPLKYLSFHPDRMDQNRLLSDRGEIKPIGPSLGNNETNYALKFKSGLYDDSDYAGQLEFIPIDTLKETKQLSIVFWINPNLDTRQHSLTLIDFEHNSLEAIVIPTIGLTMKHLQHENEIEFSADFNCSNGASVGLDVINMELDPAVAWYHVVLTVSGHEFSMTINGNAKIRKSIDRTKIYHRKMNGIVLFPEGISSESVAHGAIDEVSIYDRVLSDKEIRQLYLSVRPK